MKIACMVTGTIKTPYPEGMVNAPIDVAVAIARGLRDAGHQVDYYAPEGSSLDVPVVTGGLTPFLRDENGKFIYEIDPSQSDRMATIWDEFLISEMIKKANNGEYDALMIHPVDKGVILGRINENIPIIYTLHDPIYPWRIDLYKRFLTPNQHLVTISDAQRKPALDLPFAATIYNGIDVDMFQFVEVPDNNVIFSGRIIKEKNPHGAIAASKIAGIPIKLFGSVYPNTDSEIYFNEYVKPEIDDASVIYGGSIDRRALSYEYGHAKALLAPIVWEEPFGLMFTEAMACGTPVIAFRRGSAPEIIVDGVTGFIVDTIEEMAEAIKKIDTIDRKACREHVLNKFSNQQMVAGYNDLLEKIVAKK